MDCIYDLDPCCSKCLWSRLSIVGDYNRYWLANKCQLIETGMRFVVKPQPVLHNHCRVMKDATDEEINTSNRNIATIRNDWWEI